MDKLYASDNIFERYILGTAGLGGIWRPVNEGESVEVILDALDAGISQIDTAPAYGDAELFVGAAIRQWRGTRPRISTKVGRLKGVASDKGSYDYSPAAMERSLESSLLTLGVNWIDTLFLHEPAAIPVGQIDQAVSAMIGFKQNGYAKRIGLGGNYPPTFNGFVQEGVFDAVMEYNRLNACRLDALGTSLAQCLNLGIDFWAASPLHMGLLGSEFETFVAHKPDWLPLKDIETACQIKLLAENLGLSLTELAFQFIKKIPRPFRIVVGAANAAEWESTASYIKAPPLEESLYQQMLGFV